MRTLGFDYWATDGGVGVMLAAAAEIAPGLADATLFETRIGFRPATAARCSERWPTA